MENEINVYDIEKLEYGVWSAEEIKNISICKIDNPKYVGSGTVYDDRMGYRNRMNSACPTCGFTKECWGHFGYIELAEPILHPMYFKEIASMLKCFCKECHHLIFEKEQIDTIFGFSKLKGIKKFKKILEKSKKNDICSRCKTPKPKIVYRPKDVDNPISMEHKQKKNGVLVKSVNVLTVDAIKKIFDDIPDEDVLLLGFDPDRIHPRNLVITCLLVIPPCARPPVITDGNICDDDLTQQYMEIVKSNNQLLKKDDDEVKSDRKDEKRQKIIKTLNFRISTLFNNSKNRARHPTDSRPYKGIKERLSGKDGRFRTNMMGKRVDQSSRTVIGADPTLKLNQVAIPYLVAQTHTKPETVTTYNIEWLTELVNTGKANFIFKPKVRDGVIDSDAPKTRINLQYGLYKRGTELLYEDIIIKNPKLELKMDGKGNVVIPVKGTKDILCVQNGDEKLNKGDRVIRNGKLIEISLPEKRNIKLELGDVVERQLMKGDRVIFNRQPF